MKKKREGFLSLELKKNEEEEESKIKENEGRVINANKEEKKKEEKKEEENKGIDVKDDYIFAAILGVYVCYYLRLDTRELRKEMNEKMSKAFGLKNFEEY